MAEILEINLRFCRGQSHRHTTLGISETDHRPTMAESRAKPPPIPPLAWPHRPATYAILFLLLLLTTLLLHPSPPLSPRTLHFIALFTAVVHLLEGIYALTLLRRIACSRNQSLPPSSLLWVLQTTLLGFPSLFLLMHNLSTMPQPHRLPTS